MHHILTEFEPVFDAADFVRAGRDLFVTRSNVTNRMGIEWLRRHLGPRYRIHEIQSRCRTPMYIDTAFVPLAPGEVLVNAEYIDIDRLREAATWTSRPHGRPGLRPAAGAGFPAGCWEPGRRETRYRPPAHGRCGGSTSSGTPLSGASTASSNGAAWPHEPTSSRSPTRPHSTSRASSSGPDADQRDRT